MYLIAFIIIFITSLLFGMAGIGSATVVIPSLFLMGFPFQESIAIGLTVNIIVSAAINFKILKSGEINISKIFPLIIGALVAPPLGVLVSHNIDKRVILWLFLIILLLGAYKSFSKALEKKSKTENFKRGRIHKLLPESLIFLLLGLSGGFLAGMLGIGGGSILLPIFVLLGLSAGEIVSIIAPLVFVSSFMGLIARIKIVKSFDWNLIIVAVFGAMTAGILCNILREKVDKKRLRFLLGVLFLIVGIKVFFLLFK